jgi:cold shock CspA family protein
VAWFDRQHGIGAITVAGTGIRVPVRAEHIDGGGQQSLRKDARVRFTIEEGPNGPRAVDVYTP